MICPQLQTETPGNEVKGHQILSIFWGTFLLAGNMALYFEMESSVFGFKETLQ